VLKHAYTHVTAFGWIWLAWVLMGTGMEFYWLAVNAGNTLSRQIWGIEHLDFAHPLEFSTWTPMHWVITLALWSFFLWLSIHFPFGYLR
jgi:hypothetical protein